jgi:hypothetical protein
MSKKTLLIFLVLIILAGGSFGYLWLTSKHSQEMENAVKTGQDGSELPPDIEEVDISLSPVDELMFDDLALDPVDLGSMGNLDLNLPDALNTSTIEVSAPSGDIQVNEENIVPDYEALSESITAASTTSSGSEAGNSQPDTATASSAPPDASPLDGLEIPN